MHLTSADPTGKGCAQFGVAEIEPRCLNGGVVGQPKMIANTMADGWLIKLRP